jgi:hypothetical protein
MFDQCMKALENPLQAANIVDDFSDLPVGGFGFADVLVAARENDTAELDELDNRGGCSGLHHRENDAIESDEAACRGKQVLRPLLVCFTDFAPWLLK